jgi:hypothetical protein
MKLPPNDTLLQVQNGPPELGQSEAPAPTVLLELMANAPAAIAVAARITVTRRLRVTVAMRFSLLVELLRG